MSIITGNIWDHMLTQIWVNFGSGNGMVPLTESLLRYIIQGFCDIHLTLISQQVKINLYSMVTYGVAAFRHICVILLTYEGCGSTLKDMLRIKFLSTSCEIALR